MTRAGLDVADRRERHDLGEADGVEPERQRGARRFRRVAMSPLPRGESPPDLDGRHEPGRGEPGEPDADAVEVDAPEAEAVVGPVGHHVVDVGVGLGPALQRSEELHHERIGVDRRVRSAVGIRPPPQQQALRTQFGDHGRTSSSAARTAASGTSGTTSTPSAPSSTNVSPPSAPSCRGPSAHEVVGRQPLGHGRRQPVQLADDGPVLVDPLGDRCARGARPARPRRPARRPRPHHASGGARWRSPAHGRACGRS